MAEGEHPLLDSLACVPSFPMGPRRRINEWNKGCGEERVNTSKCSTFHFEAIFPVHRRHWVKTIVGRFSVGKKQKDFLNPQL